MIDLNPGQIDIVKAILRRIVPDRVVWAFGSRVTGAAKTYSDLDLAILGNERLPVETLSELNESFAASDLPFRVDVVDWNRIAEPFRSIIEKCHERLV